MKKMKNLFIALLVGMFMLPVMNAEANPNTALQTLKIGDVTVDLTKCTIDTNTLNEETTYSCEVTVPWNSSKLAIIATPVTGASLSTASVDFVSEGLDLTNLVENGSTEFPIVVEKTGEDATLYDVRVTKAVAETPVLDSLVVKSGETTFTLDPNIFNPTTKTYKVTVPYSVSAVNVITTAAEDVEGAGTREVTDLTEGVMTSINIELTRGSARNTYEVQITREENPMIASIETAIEADETLKGRTSLYDLTATTAQFMYGNPLDNSVIVKQYNVTFAEGADAATIVAALKEAMKKEADFSMLVPNDGKISDADMTAIKTEGKEILVPTESEVIWVLDGSKIADTDKGFSVVVKTGEEVEKELYDKINKLLDPKDNGLIIDFEHDGNLPKGTKVMISAENYAVGDLLSLYYYNEKTGKLELYKKNLKVEKYTLGDESENVVMVDLEHCSSYVLLPAKNNAQTGVLNVLLYTVMALGSLAGIVFLLKKKAN